MKYNAKLPILNLEKGVMKETVEKDAKDLSYAKVFVTALLSDPGEEGRQQNQEEKVRKFKLATRVCDHEDEVSLSSEEVVLIKKCVNRIYPTMIVGRVEEFFEEEKGTLN